MRRSLIGLVALGVLTGCGSTSGEVRAQWLVSVGTDAPVPELGDRLLVELLNDDGELACSACRRELAAAEPTRFPLSFGVVPDGEITRLRVRLYRAAMSGPDGLPESASLIDFVGRLPDAATKTEVHVVLATSCFGIPSDLAAERTCLPRSGEVGPEPTLAADDALPDVASSPLAQSTPCVGAAPAGMLCVPGGLFVLGSPRPTLPTFVGSSSPEHLVKVSPFALDVDELTVGAMRALVRKGSVSRAPVARGPSGDQTEACTYLGADDASHDAWPVNCLPKSLAEEACGMLGKRLPTEAEWEWAAGNRGEETTYTWGEADDACERAIVARGREAVEAVVDENAGCRTETAAEVLPWGAVPEGDPDDVTELGLRNLGGNVAEFVADEFAEYDEPCWTGAALLVDPRCTTASTEALVDDGASLLRGGSWTTVKGAARVTTRVVFGGAGQNPSNGIRCALSLR